MQYSFTLDPKCPHCGTRFDKCGSVKANGYDAYVQDRRL